MTEQEVEKQLTQRRLDIGEINTTLINLKNQLNAIQRAVDAIDTTSSSISDNNIDSTLDQGSVIHKLPHTFRGIVTFVKDLLPSVTNIVNIGSASLFFKKLFTTDVRVNSTTASRPLKVDANKDIISGTIDLTSTNDITGVLTVPNGGTGAGTFTSTYLLYGNGTSAVGADAGLTWGSGTFSVKASGANSRIKVDSDVGQNSTVTWYNQGTQYWTIDIVSATDLALRFYDNVNSVFRLIINPAGTFAIDGNIQTTTSTIGFWGSTPASKQTLNSYTTNAQSGAYLGFASGLVGSPYAGIGDLNALRVAYENLRASYDDLRTKMRTSTLVG